MEAENWIKSVESSTHHMQKAEPNAFLLTRIEQKIENLYSNNFKKPISWALSLSVVLIILVNVFILVKSFKSVKNENNIAQSFNLIPNNSIYK